VGGRKTVIPERIEIERGWEGGGMRERERERERMSGEDYGWTSAALRPAEGVAALSCADLTRH